MRLLVSGNEYFHSVFPMQAELMVAFVSSHY